MQIKLDYCADDANKIGKTLTNRFDMQGSLKAGTSILNPTVLIEIYGLDTSQYTTNVDQLTKCNYMRIPDFNRNYFITDIVFYKSEGTKGLYYVTGHVDVLESYKTEIKALYAEVIARGNSSTKDVNTGHYITSEETETTYMEMTAQTTARFDDDGGSYILTTACKE